MNELTQNQSRILQTLAQLVQRGEMPTLRDLARELGLAGASSVQPQLEAIEKKGFLQIQRSGTTKQLRFHLAPQAAQVIHPFPVPSSVVVESPATIETPSVLAAVGDALRLRFPILADIPCGPLEDAIASIDEDAWVDPGDFIKTYDDSWFARAKGKSMLPRFEPRDIIHFRRDLQWSNGDLCAVQVYSDKGFEGECQGTFKQFFLQENGHTVVLKPLNPSFKPMIVDAEYVKVVGVHRRGVIRGGG